MARQELSIAWLVQAAPSSEAIQTRSSLYSALISPFRDLREEGYVSYIGEDGKKITDPRAREIVVNALKGSEHEERLVAAFDAVCDQYRQDQTPEAAQAPKVSSPAATDSRPKKARAKAKPLGIGSPS